MFDLHAVDLRKLLLVRGGAHLARARGDRPWSRPRRRAACDCDRGVDRGVAAADHDHAPPDRQLALVRRLAQLGDEIDRVRARPSSVSPSNASALHALQAHAQEDGVVVAAQLRRASNRGRAPGRYCSSMPPMPRMKSTSVLGEIVGHLVCGDAVFVEPAGRSPRLEHRHLMARAAPGDGRRRAPPARRRPRRPACPWRARARRDGAGARRAAGRWRSAAAADATGLLLLRHAHAGLLAQDLGRADPRAGAAEDIGFEDGAAPRPRHCPVAIWRMKPRNVDAGGAGLDAGRVVAEIAAIGLDQRRLARQRRMDVAEIRRGRPRASRPAAMPGCLPAVSFAMLVPPWSRPPV